MLYGNVPGDPLTAGLHRIRIDYSDGGGNAILQLNWDMPGVGNQVVATSLAPRYGLATRTHGGRGPPHPSPAPSERPTRPKCGREPSLLPEQSGTDTEIVLETRPFLESSLALCRPEHSEGEAECNSTPAAQVHHVHLKVC